MVKRQDPDVVDRYARKYFEKTVSDIYRSTEMEKIRNDLPLISFDESYLKNLEEKFKSKEEKAANIVFTLNRFVLVEKNKNPSRFTSLASIGGQSALKRFAVRGPGGTIGVVWCLIKFNFDHVRRGVIIRLVQRNP